MREIFFRGKRLDNGEWAEGGIYHNSEDEIVFIIKDTGLGYHEFIEVIPETVGQFTGLCDKNGTKIFEGDIVEGKDHLEKGLEVYGYIDHRNGSFVIVGDFLTYYRWLDYEVKVIGDIHDKSRAVERRNGMRIKGFDKDLRCRGFQFEVGKEYFIDTKGRALKLCSDTVFHYCDSLQKVHSFYGVAGNNNRFCEIEVLGEEVSDDEKCGSNHIRIVREIVGEELDIMKGLINGNTGIFNSGNCNSGDRNSGNRNSGNYNSGDYNSGNRNSGNRNSGNYNSGDRNSGNRNSGNYNSGDRNSGFFCTEKDPFIMLFDKPTDIRFSEFYRSEWYHALNSTSFTLTEWIYYSDEEKNTDADKALIGGYLRTYTYKEACKKWWDAKTEGDRKTIRSMPNFDAAKFKEITGIEVEEERNK